jgi:hypothetical protein
MLDFTIAFSTSSTHLGTFGYRYRFTDHIRREYADAELGFPFQNMQKSFSTRESSGNGNPILLFASRE